MNDLDLLREKGEAAIKTMDHPITIELTRICIEYLGSEYELEARIVGKLALILEPRVDTVTEITNMALTEIGTSLLGFGKGE